jgi:hypothetical protein
VPLLKQSTLVDPSHPDESSPDFTTRSHRPVCWGLRLSINKAGAFPFFLAVTDFGGDIVDDRIN